MHNSKTMSYVLNNLKEIENDTYAVEQYAKDRMSFVRKDGERAYLYVMGGVWVCIFKYNHSTKHKICNSGREAGEWIESKYSELATTKKRTSDMEKILKEIESRITELSKEIIPDKQQPILDAQIVENVKMKSFVLKQMKNETTN